MANEIAIGESRRERWRRFSDEHRELLFIYSILLGIILLAAVFLPRFRSFHNITNVLRQSVTLGLISVGQTLAILVGGIDLSVGAAISLVDVYATGFMAKYTLFWQVGGMVIALLMLGLLIGLINATVITRLRVVPFIGTMGVGAILQGLVILYAKKPGGNIAPGWDFFAFGTIGPISFPILFLMIVVAITWFLLNKTVWGRHVRATGGSETIARLSGVLTRRVTTYAFMFCSLMAAVTGLYLTSRMGAGDPRVGGLEYDRYDLDSITAVLVGGTRLGGGKGSVLGSVAGVLIVSFANNIFNLIGVNPYVQWVVKGIIILGAVAVYTVRGQGRQA